MNIIISPVKTEKALGKVEKEGVITFYVDLNATKKDVKSEVEKLFGVKVDRVTTAITPKGVKKAFVRLSKDSNIDDVIEKLKLLA